MGIVWTPLPRRVILGGIMRAHAVVSLVGGVAVLLSACAPSTVLRRAFPPSFPHDEYAQSLRQTGLDRTALGRDWLAAAERALHTTLSVRSPTARRVTSRPTSPAPSPIGSTRAAASDSESKWSSKRARWASCSSICFDRIPARTRPEHVTSAPAGTGRLEFEATLDGAYLLRIQPELLRGGRYTLTQHALASLRFPVLGKDGRAVSSGFGAERDGGRRAHHGIDILAPRGTPVLSAGDGVVSSVAVTDIGGKVVWVWDPARDLSLYYAHLDSQGVSPGTRVRAGDALGTVGNTGNARTTVPHLHFGIYHRGDGPIDPMPFVHEPPAAPPPVADTSALGPGAASMRPPSRSRRHPSIAPPSSWSCLVIP